MRISNSYMIWIEAGYKVFASDGPEGIQVERLARITDLNKSGFYHYFGDRDAFIEQLMKHHNSIAKVYGEEVQQVIHFDPDFIHILLRNKESILVQRQLVRNRHLPFYDDWYLKINNHVDKIIVPKWATFLGMEGNVEFAMRYFDQVRDMFYARITADNYNEEFLRSLIHEAKNLILDLTKQKVLQNPG